MAKLPESYDSNDECISTPNQSNNKTTIGENTEQSRIGLSAIAFL